MAASKHASAAPLSQTSTSHSCFPTEQVLLRCFCQQKIALLYRGYRPQEHQRWQLKSISSLMDLLMRQVGPYCIKSIPKWFVYIFQGSISDGGAVEFPFNCSCLKMKCFSEVVLYANESTSAGLICMTSGIFLLILHIRHPQSNTCPIITLIFNEIV